MPNDIDVQIANTWLCPKSMAKQIQRFKASCPYVSLKFKQILGGTTRFGQLDEAICVIHCFDSHLYC